jgi:Dolichyl-phosphate-mannose-protein mannosyltransferase
VKGLGVASVSAPSGSTASSSPWARQSWAVPGAFALAAFALYLLPGLVGPYGPFIDELYYVACARHLAWGYVDHPPLAPFLLRVAMAVGGDHLVVLRLLASAFGAMTVLGTGLLARRLGAGRFGQGVASAAMLSVPIAQVLWGFYSMNAIEPLLWLALCWLLVDIEDGGHPALWIAFGVVVGLAGLTKHTVVTFLLALGLGLLLTPARRHLATRWPWVGAAVAALIVAPNVWWQVAHDWPSLEFYRNAALNKNQPIGPLQVLGQQVVFIGPGTLPVWLAGLWLLIRRRAPFDLRHLALAYLVLLAFLMASGQSRPDRALGIYPVLFAAGGAVLGSLAAGRRWVRFAAPAWMAGWGALLLPLGVPVLPPPQLSAYAAALGVVPQLERGEGKRTALPQWFADRLGWEALVEDVAAVRDSLPAEERQDVMFFAPSYGQAGALEWLGEARGLAPVYCTHNSYYLWGPPPRDPAVAIVIGDRRERLEELFVRVELARWHECGLCMPWRNHMPIWVAREPRVRIAARWRDWKHYE